MAEKKNWPVTKNKLAQNPGNLNEITHNLLELKPLKW
jgi:hypothetical protein